jgi:alpha-beta hydrolase superfamily lysophospholipase
MPERITIPSAAGRAISALYRQAGPAVALMVHGITAEKTESGFYTALGQRLLARGMSVLSIDLAGHGDSELPFDQTCVTLMAEDLVAACAFAAARHGALHLVCASFSASLYLLAQAAGLAPAAGVVLLNPVTDYRANFIEADTAWGRAFCPQLSAPDFWTVPHHAVHGGPLTLSRRFISELALMSAPRPTLRVARPPWG